MTTGLAIIAIIGVAAVALFVVGIAVLAWAASVGIQDEFDMIVRERDEE